MIFFVEKCVHCAQSVGGTELQQTPSILVNIRVTFLNNTFPGSIVNAHMRIEIVQRNKGF